MNDTVRIQLDISRADLEQWAGDMRIAENVLARRARTHEVPVEELDAYLLTEKARAQLAPQLAELVLSRAIFRSLHAVAPGTPVKLETYPVQVVLKTLPTPGAIDRLAELAGEGA